MSQMNISMSPVLKTWIDHRIAEGHYSSHSDYLSDLVRRDQNGAEDETEWLKALIAEGDASGVIDKDAKDVLREIMAERPAHRG